MTKDEIKKGLQICTELCPELCKNFDCPYYTRSEDCVNDILKDALALITEQEKEIERLKAQVKQAKIDVLNELKERCKFDGHTVAVYKNDIDEMIEELKK